MKKYDECIMENSDCDSCSLVNYGKDCRNIPVNLTPQEKWQAKAGLVSKSYKLKKDIVEEFAAVCEKTDTTLAKQLTKMMQEFIKNNK